MDKEENKKIKVIGITGPIGSGKDTVAEYIGDKLGVKEFQISAPIKDYIRAQGLPVTRDNCQIYGNIIAEKFGPDYSAKIFLEALQKSGQTLGIVSGMRQMAQIEFLEQNTDFFLIAVDAPAEVRYARVTARGTVVEKATLAEFVAQEVGENSGDSIMRLFDCMKKAKITLPNYDDIEELYKKCDELIVQINTHYGII